MAITADRMDWWFNRNSNVLLRGKHGVGKTAMIQECFERNGLKLNESYIYLSASTLDPWVDLIGVPKEQVDANGEKYLGLVRPELLYKGNIQAIFFDEYNRSPKEVRNAVMELIQKKSINGFKFPNLRMVWAAVNPVTEDNSYAVEDDDKAQIDRFKVQIDVPYECDTNYFSKTYGDGLASAAIEWWNGLPEAQKDLVSPRRLDYALDEFVAGGFVEDIIPSTTNISKLIQALRNGSVERKLQEFYASKDKKAIKAFFSLENNINGAMKYLEKNADYLRFFLPFVNKEKLMSIIMTDDKILKHVIAYREDSPEFQVTLQNGLNGGNPDLVRRIRNTINSLKKVRTDSMYQPFPTTTPKPSVFSPTQNRLSSKEIFANVLREVHLTNFKIIEEKAKMLAFLSDNMIADISSNEGDSICNFLKKIVQNSTVATIKADDFKNLIPILNYVVQQHDSLRNSSHFQELAKRLQEWGLVHQIINNQEEITNEFCHS